MFTSGNQVLNLLQLANDRGIVDELRAGFRNVVVVSIGPTTSEMLRNEELPVDMEPSHPKMGHLVTEAAQRARELLHRKRTIRKQTADFGLEDKFPNPQSPIRNFRDTPFLK